MLFRPFLASDVAKLPTFHCSSPSSPEWEQLIDEMFHDELVDVIRDPKRHFICWVAEAETGDIAGIAAFEAYVETKWELVAIGVDVRHRGRRVTKALISHAVASTPIRDARALRLFVHKRNSRMGDTARSLPADRMPRSDEWDYLAYTTDPKYVVMDMAMHVGRVRPAAEQTAHRHRQAAFHGATREHGTFTGGIW